MCKLTPSSPLAGTGSAWASPFWCIRGEKTSGHRFKAIILIALAALCPFASQAEESSSLPEREPWNLHFQATTISQGHDEFASPYSGTNSLPPREPIRTSYTATLFLGARLWAGSEVFVNPELAGGRGIGGVTGVAGFPNGDIARVSRPEPTVSLARVFLRQTFGLGGDQEKVEPGPNQLAGARATSRASRLRWGKSASATSSTATPTVMTRAPNSCVEHLERNFDHARLPIRQSSRLQRRSRPGAHLGCPLPCGVLKRSVAA
jgi:hypothetical protein